MKVQFIAVSQNAKTGPIPASIVERASCWSGCALYENGCYAETGPLAMHWDRVSRGLTGGFWSDFCAKVAALRPGRLWRYAQAGDLPGYGSQIDGTLLEGLVAANAGKNVIAFTHKPVLGDGPIAVENRGLVATALSSGFTINLSADKPAHADMLAELRIAPVVTVLARAYARRAVRHRFKKRRDEWAETIGEWRDRTASLPRYTPAGRRIAVCPATYSAATCKTCGACARIRDAVIGFPAHGAWRKVEAATAVRDVPAGESWVFPEHRTMAEVIAKKSNGSLTPSPSRSAGLEGRGIGPIPNSVVTTPRSAACLAGFLRFRPELSSGSNRDVIADRPSVGCSVGIGATLNRALPERGRRAQAAIIATPFERQDLPESV
jgi:hypothetical protein